MAVTATLLALAVLMAAESLLLFRGEGELGTAMVVTLELLRAGGLIALTSIIFWLVWLLRYVPKTPARLVVLAIGAHPDDIELGCGAALLRYREEGHETHAIVLSGGENGVPDAVRAGASRVQEAQKGAKIMQLNSLTALDFPDSKLEARHHEIKQAIEDICRRLQPDLVFTHNNHDIHSDHRVVHRATLEATRRVPTVLCYENPNTPPDFRPNFFVDITLYVDYKLAAVKCHATQARHKPYLESDIVRSMARVRGRQARAGFAEAFEAVRYSLRNNE